MAYFNPDHPITYLSFDIYPLRLTSGKKVKYKPLIKNWRQHEPIKSNEVFDTPEEAIAYAKGKIDDYLHQSKGVI